MKTIVCFGAFDGLDEGHKAYLDEARSLGESLLVALESDRSVLARNGQLPGNGEQLRRERLEAARAADEIRISEREDLLNLLQETRPDVIFLPFYETALARQLEEALSESSSKWEIALSKPFPVDTLQNDSTSVDGHDSLPL
ncbi:hypothetical protein COX00_03005 [Candidatus Uhrbacteria bacterium CG22_combo_CG10-13_8_21_14_all_47_17]|uniref:Cytidyltransferase-like domain-containing protein n=1 Tax=Candidatus Uhrbacteria bacterium CG22_combo_CG10-13_8_21_14_all_47_17 TaxID=1975041 RepID=A0A2H0BU18_9BACT|nr:MAG: hypothetical protein COX00_03005 [Candidatus Uhrbacteria bacterium CG22_combo_CG10-13_8_21_14_all_47_17]